MERIWYVQAYNRAVDTHFVTRGKTFRDTVQQYEEMLAMSRDGDGDISVRMCSLSRGQLKGKPKELNYRWSLE